MVSVQCRIKVLWRICGLYCHRCRSVICRNLIKNLLLELMSSSQALLKNRKLFQNSLHILFQFVYSLIHFIHLFLCLSARLHWVPRATCIPTRGSIALAYDIFFSFSVFFDMFWESVERRNQILAVLLLNQLLTCLCQLQHLLCAGKFSWS